jgi:hypothetical protein
MENPVKDLQQGDIMNIISVSFSKIEATRKAVPKGKINISNNIKVTGVEDAKMSFDKTKNTLKINFQFTTAYEPDFASILLEGNVVIIDEAKGAKDILDKWKKDKGLDKGIAMDVMNSVMTKCSVESLIMAKELNLPSPIPLPKVRGSDSAPLKE